MFHLFGSGRCHRDFFHTDFTDFIYFNVWHIQPRTHIRCVFRANLTSTSASNKLPSRPCSRSAKGKKKDDIYVCGWMYDRSACIFSFGKTKTHHIK